ncbi:hypothetical protein J1614_011951 [Plenodomus biglobosus]|nr:hypothetical protein J1614_011951 [Plenodomus biglobosus]
MALSIANPATEATMATEPSYAVPPSYHASFPNKVKIPVGSHFFQSTPAPQDGAQNEFYPIQARITQLLQEQDNFRSLSRSQAQQLSQQDRIISQLQAENSQLRQANLEATITGKHILSRYHGLIEQHATLEEKLANKKRAYVKLRKSERAKTGIQQRNLIIKATLQRVMMREAPESTEQDANIKATLREALALAMERIDELENAGENVIDALGRMDESDGDGEGDGERDGQPSLAEVEVTFRGVLGDKGFAEQKENWEELMEE